MRNNIRSKTFLNRENIMNKLFLAYAEEMCLVIEITHKLCTTYFNTMLSFKIKYDKCIRM